MNRRNFLQKLGLSAAVCAAVPALIKPEEPFTVEKYKEAALELEIEGKGYSDITLLYTDPHCMPLNPQLYSELINQYGKGFNTFDFLIKL